MLPDGKTLLTTVWNVGSWDDASIVAFSMKDGTSKVVLKNGSFGRYSPSGHLLFMRGGNLMAVTFDAETLVAGTNAVTMVQGVSHGGADGEAQYAISAAGHLVYAAGGDSEPLSALLWMDAQGRTQPIVPTRRRYGSVDIAADGRSAVVTIEGSTYDIWSLDIDRDSVTRISHGGDDNDALITADGSRVIWASSRSGAYNLFTRASDGSGAEERLTTSDKDQGEPAVTPDGGTVLWSQTGQRGDIWMMPLATRKPRPLIATPNSEFTPDVSPDGRWLAYASDESGEEQVYFTSFPTPAGKWQVSIDGGIAPRWMPNGREIVYQKGTKVFIAPVELTPRPRAGKPRLLADGLYDTDCGVAPDGRLAMILSEGRKTTTEFNLVLNFAEELKRRVP
jgi:Tol biopolymer transport system component